LTRDRAQRISAQEALTHEFILKYQRK